MANTLTFAHQTITDDHLFGEISFLVDLNTGEEFSIGNAASASVTFVTDIPLPLYTKDSENGTVTWTKDSTARGRYYITEVTKGDSKYTVTAYDAMLLLDTNISALSLSYPLTVSAAASAIATYLGCTVSGTIINSTCSVSELSEDLTIRDLMSYVAEASGCSIKINGSDELCFMYYEDSGVELTASDYKKLEVADYACAAIDNVTILNSVGAAVATSGAGTNSLYIEANPFLEEATATEAAAILAVVGGFSYIPLTCELFDDDDIEVGTVVTFTGVSALVDSVEDPLDYEESGVLGLLQSVDRIPHLVMHVESGEDGAVISSVGSDDRAEYNKSFETMLAAVSKEALDAADEASTKATKYITRIDNAGIKVHAETNDSTNYAKIDANGLKVYKGGDLVAEFGATARIGISGQQRIEVTSNGIKGCTSDNVAMLQLTPTWHCFGNPASTRITMGLGDSPYLYMNVNGTQCLNADANGLVVGNPSSGHSTVKSDGLHVWTGTEATATNEVAFFGSTARIGKTSKCHLNISDSEIDFYNGQTLFGAIGTVGGNGLAISNYYGTNRYVDLCLEGDDGVLSVYSYHGSNTYGAMSLSSSEFNVGLQGVASMKLANSGLEISKGIKMSGNNYLYVDDKIVCGRNSNGDWFFGYGSYSNNEKAVYFDGNVVNIRSNGNVNINGDLYNQKAYDNTNSYATNLFVGNTGHIYRTTNTSSRRYKNSIKDVDSKELNPHNLYDIEVKQFRYNDDVITDKSDVRYGKDLIGFISEQVKECYPIAVDINEDGECEAWNGQYIIPPMLALIQEQHKEIEELKRRMS